MVPSRFVVIAPKKVGIRQIRISNSHITAATTAAGAALSRRTALRTATRAAIIVLIAMNVRIASPVDQAAFLSAEQTPADGDLIGGHKEVAAGLGIDHVGG